MKKIFTKAISLVLSLALLSSLCVSMFAFEASAEEVVGATMSQNLLNGKSPVAIYNATNTNLYATNYQAVFHKNQEFSSRHGWNYYYGNLYNNTEDVSDRKTAAMKWTDGNDGYNDGTGDKTAVFSSYINCASGETLATTSQVIVYELDSASFIDSFKLVSSYAESAYYVKGYELYAGLNRDTLLSPDNKILSVSDANGVALTTNIAEDDIRAAKYIALVITTPDAKGGSATRIAEIALYGTATQSIIANTAPSAIYNATNTNLYATNYQAVFHTNQAFTSTHGWDYYYGNLYNNTEDVSDRKTAALKWTDGINGYNDGTGDSAAVLSTYIRAKTGETLATTSQVIIYQLDEISYLTNLEFVSSYKESKYRVSGYDIYTSLNRETLLDETNKVKSVTDLTAISNDLDISGQEAKPVNFVAIVITKPDVSGGSPARIAEIGIYGTKAIDSETENNNLVSGKMPVGAYTSADGSSLYNYKGLRLNGSTTQVGEGFGGLGILGTATAEYQPLRALTDGKTGTYACITGNHTENGGDVVLVWKFNTMSEVSAIKLIANNSSFGIDAYLSTSYSALFNAANKVASTGINSNVENTVELETSVTALYIGLILDVNNVNNKEFISELCVYGNELVFEDSGLKALNNPNNPNANEETKSFYQYLQLVSDSEGVLIGAHLNELQKYVDPGQNDNYFAFIERNYGVSPTILSIDLKFDNAVYMQYYDEGAIPLFMNSNLLPDLSNYEEYNTYIKYLDSDYEPTDEEYDLCYNLRDEYMYNLEIMADTFESLEADGLKTYMFRPFGEMSYSSFFGDAAHPEGAVYFKNVWQQMYDYFLNERGLKGILMVFAPPALDDARTLEPIEYYPGNDYVDIIAPTCYSANGDGVLNEIVNYDEYLATGKPFGLSEMGVLDAHNSEKTADCLKALNSLKTMYKEAAFASIWFGYRHGINNHENDTEFITDSYLINTKTMLKHQKQDILPPANVIVYSDNSLEGEATVIPAGEYTLADIQNTEISSLEFMEGYKITFYTGSDYTGDTWVFGKNIMDFSELSVSFNSIKIEAAESYTTGDSNSDNAIDVRDLVHTKKILAKSITDYSVLATDTDYDGTVKSGDLVIIRQFLLGVIDSF